MTVMCVFVCVCMVMVVVGLFSDEGCREMGVGARVGGEPSTIPCSLVLFSLTRSRWVGV